MVINFHLRFSLLISVFCFFFLSSFAPSKIDSLKNILAQPNQHDSVLFQASLVLAWELKSVQPTEALDLSYSALSLAERLNDRNKIGDALSHIGIIYWQMGDFNKSLDYHLEANEIFLSTQNNNGIAKSLTNIGIVFSDQSLYDKALEYFFQALSLYTQSENNIGLSAVLNNIGLIYTHQGDYELAEKFHLRSLEIKTHMNDTKGMAYSYNNLGLVNQGEGNYSEAMEYFNKALSIRMDLNDIREIANTSSNIGYLNFLMRDYDVANENLLRALRLYKEVDDQSGIAKTHNYLGKVAVNTLEFVRARRFFEMSLEMAEDIGLKRMSKENYRDLAQLMANLRDFERAYDYQSRFISLKDSIFREESRKRMFEMQTMYDREMKGSELQLLRKNEEITALSLQKHQLIRNFLIGGVLLVLVLLFLLYNRFLIVRRSNRLLEKQKKEISQTNHQLVELNHSLLDQKQRFEELNRELSISNKKFKESEKHLIETNATKDKFFSIISHDLRNPFASIVSFSRILKRDIHTMSTIELLELALELDKSVLKINNLLENLLQWSRTQTGKIKYKPEYIAIHEIVKENLNLFENNAKEKNLILEDKVDDNLAVWADRNMADTVIRNLVSNAIKYSLPGGLISLSSQIKNNKAYISVRDYGVGMSKANKEKIFRSDSLHSTYGTMDEKGSGLGLLLCKEFVEKQGGEITFESEPEEGSVFTFSLPLEP